MSWQSPLRSAPAWRTVVVLLVVIVLTFAVRPVLVDVSNVAAGSIPGDGPDRQYARHPGLAYVHILTAVPYLLLAPLQLWRPFRERHFPVHRRIGRIVVPLAAVGTVAAICFGLLYPVGGLAESTASLAFGSWFVACLGRAWVAIRAGDAILHRRWMIRAFVTGLAVGTIRIWVGVFTAFGLFDWAGRFGLGFWLAFLAHVAVGEWWLRTNPDPAAANDPRGSQPR